MLFLPDASFATSYLGKRTLSLSRNAVKYMNRTSSYLKNNSMSIPLPPKFTSPEIEITAYVDASMGSSEDPHGTTGWVILANGYPVTWRSKKQSRVSRSSLKAELIALHDLVDYLEWFCTVLSSSRVKSNTTIHSDSKDLVQLVNARHPKPGAKNDIFALDDIRKKIGIVPLASLDSSMQELTRTNPTKLLHIPGSENPSDALTKSANKISLQTLIKTIQKALPPHLRSTPRKRERGGE